VTIRFLATDSHSVILGSRNTLSHCYTAHLGARGVALGWPCGPCLLDWRYPSDEMHCQENCCNQAAIQTVKSELKRFLSEKCMLISLPNRSIQFKEAILKEFSFKENCYLYSWLRLHGAKYAASKFTLTKLVNIREVSTSSPVRTNWRQSRTRQLVTVDIVAKVEHIQLGRYCRKQVITPARSSPECRIRLCRQYVPGLRCSFKRTR